jgi:hypothetical protein
LDVESQIVVVGIFQSIVLLGQLVECKWPIVPELVAFLSTASRVTRAISILVLPVGILGPYVETELVEAVGQ